MTSKDVLKRAAVIGVPITATNMNDCVEFLFDRIEDIKGEYVCVSNAHTTVMAHDDPDYYRVQTESLMSIPDGKPLSVIGKKIVSTMDRVTGPDLMRDLLQKSSGTKLSHYFYGNTKENLSELISYLQKQYPETLIAGYEPSVFRPLLQEEKDQLADRINASGADYIWIATGAPRQEILCNELKGRVDGLMVGVGGAFNVIAGITPEAPKWMQNLSLEWLYRLMQEPRRLIKRYVVTNTKFLYYAATNMPAKQNDTKEH